MIPNLTLIVAAYVVVRLASFILRALPDGGGRGARLGLAFGSGLAIVLVVLCTLDTIGVGLSIGSTLEAKRTYQLGVMPPR
jgi:hypothetical protein